MTQPRGRKKRPEDIDFITKRKPLRPTLDDSISAEFRKDLERIERLRERKQRRSQRPSTEENSS